MKDKAFARAVKREDLRAGADVLGLPLDEHIANVIGFMREQADALGLRGTLLKDGRVGGAGCRVTRMAQSAIMPCVRTMPNGRGLDLRSSRSTA